MTRISYGPRVIENFLDVAHLPFVHSGLLGDPGMPEIDDYEAQTTPDGVVARDIKVWQPNPDGTGRATTWQVGIFASFVSGLVQTAGAFCTDWMRRYVPRAALLCPLAGIAMAFLCLGFIFGVFQTPEVALLPAVMIMTVYASRLRLPGRLPVGLVAMAVGAIAVASLKGLHLYSQPAGPPLMPLGVHLPHVVNLIQFLRQGEGWKYLSIILPMSVLDTLVSLQILESVKLAGDDYPTRPSLRVNGVATLTAPLFGSPFPTTLYFGHMVHKSNGARAGYSIFSGAVVMLVCMTGLVPAVLHWVPLAVVAMVIVWFAW